MTLKFCVGIGNINRFWMKLFCLWYRYQFS